MDGGPDGENRGGEQRHPGAHRPEPDRRPEEKRQLQRQRRLCRHRPEWRQLDERAAKIGGPHHDQADADSHGLGDARPRHRSDPARQPHRHAHDGGNDRQLREDVAEEPLVPDRPIRLAEEPRDGGGIEKAGDHGCHRQRREECRQPPRRVEARRCVAQQPDGAGRKDGLDAVGEVQGQARAPAATRSGAGQPSGPAGRAAAPATTAAVAPGGGSPSRWRSVAR